MNHGDDGEAGEGAGLVNARISGENSRTYRVPPAVRRALRSAGRHAGAVAVALPGGVRVKRHTPGPDNVGEPIPGGRGEVCGFSPDSRRRMIQRLMAIDWAAGPVYFLTLTWHEGYGSDWRNWKRDLAAWRKRLQYTYGDQLRGAIWRMELQQRKSGLHAGEVAPHFHVALFWNVEPDLASFRQWVSASWHAVADPTSAAHAKACSQVLRARNTSGREMGRLLGYLSKYMGKLQRWRMVNPETGEVLGTGRVWGMWGDPPMRIVATVSMGQGAYGEFLKRVNAKGEGVGSWYLSNVSDQWSGFSIMGDGGELAAELFDGLDVEITSGALPELGGGDKVPK